MATKVQRTSNYNLFKFLETNREVRETQVKKILASIRNVGYILNPIIVNEKMEIIDGQGRYSALKELGEPIDYIVVPGLGIEECRAMNINQSNWTTADYIHSFAADGNTSYKYLEILLNRYRNVSANTVYNAVVLVGEVKSGSIKKGEFICSDEDYIAADERLAYINQFVDIARELVGRRDFFYAAVAFAYSHPDIDPERLKASILKNYRRLPPITNMEDALNGVADLYNYRNTKQPKVYLENDYRRMLEANSMRNRQDSYKPRSSRDNRGKKWGR